VHGHPGFRSGHDEWGSQPQRHEFNPCKQPCVCKPYTLGPDPSRQTAEPQAFQRVCALLRLGGYKKILELVEGSAGRFWQQRSWGRLTVVASEMGTFVFEGSPQKRTVSAAVILNPILNWNKSSQNSKGVRFDDSQL